MPLVTNKKLQGITTVDGTSINMGMDVTNSLLIKSAKYNEYGVLDNFFDGLAIDPDLFGIDFANELKRNSYGEFYNRHVMGIVYEFKGFVDGINISIKTDIGYVSFSIPHSQIKYRWYTDMIDWKEEENEETEV